jgi:hypothetical protein
VRISESKILIMEVYQEVHVSDFDCRFCYVKIILIRDIQKSLCGYIYMFICSYFW